MNYILLIGELFVILILARRSEEQDIEQVQQEEQVQDAQEPQRYTLQQLLKRTIVRQAKQLVRESENATTQKLFRQEISKLTAQYWLLQEQIHTLNERIQTLNEQVRLIQSQPDNKTHDNRQVD